MSLMYPKSRRLDLLQATFRQLVKGESLLVKIVNFLLERSNLVVSKFNEYRLFKKSMFKLMISGSNSS